MCAAGCDRRIMLALAYSAALASVLPRVEDPWPESIGIELPFTLAGIGTVLFGFALAEAAPERRDRASQKGGVYGFWIGTLFYALSLANQVTFGL